MLQEAERAIREEAEKLLRQNPEMTATEARAEAEKNNGFIRTIAGASASGASIGSVAGPMGAAVGAGLGLAIGLVTAIKNECSIQ